MPLGASFGGTTDGGAGSSEAGSSSDGAGAADSAQASDGNTGSEASTPGDASGAADGTTEAGEAAAAGDATGPAEGGSTEAGNAGDATAEGGASGGDAGMGFMCVSGANSCRLGYIALECSSSANCLSSQSCCAVLDDVGGFAGAQCQPAPCISGIVLCTATPPRTGCQTNQICVSSARTLGLPMCVQGEAGAGEGGHAGEGGAAQEGGGTEGGGSGGDSGGD